MGVAVVGGDVQRLVEVVFLELRGAVDERQHGRSVALGQRAAEGREQRCVRGTAVDETLHHRRHALGGSIRQRRVVPVMVVVVVVAMTGR